MDQTKIYQIYEIFCQVYPHPSTELNYQTHFELLIAVILSAKSQDKVVNKATHDLFAIANTPKKLLLLGEEMLVDKIKTIGLHKNKAKNILKTCELLIKNHNSQIPNNRNDLEALPGVGRKTANIILNIAFGHSTIAVDTHVFRVANRTKIAPGHTTKLVEQALINNTPSKFKKNAHHWLILHGRNICQAKQKKCLECPIVFLCECNEKIV